VLNTFDCVAAVVAGLLFDYQQSYNDTFIFAGLTMAFSGIIVLLPWLKRRIRGESASSCAEPLAVYTIG